MKSDLETLVIDGQQQYPKWEYIIRHCEEQIDQATLITLNQYLSPLCEDDHYRAGVMDAFCEIVKAGVKRIAFSHATDDYATFQKDLHAAFLLSQKYNIHLYVEDQLLETILFKNTGHYVIIFYANPLDIQAYLALKEHPQSTLVEKQTVAFSLGELLSYDKAYVTNLINQYESH